VVCGRYEPEEDLGASPGMDGFPIFETDMGRVGMITCYESWFPDTIRILALRGAELVLFSSEGYFPALMTARAADNGVWLVAASGDPANVWDTAGHQGGAPEPYGLSAPTSILEFHRNTTSSMVTATLDMTKKYSPAYWGGPMRSAPGGRRVRYSGARLNDLDVAREVSRWWEQ
jgi:predicted amidohydrolase